MELFICDNLKYGIERLLYYKDNPQKSCPGVTDPRTRYIVYGQPGIGKTEQIMSLVKKHNIPRYELLISNSVLETTNRIKSIQLSPEDVLIIKNVHLLPQLCSDEYIRSFALKISMIDNYIIGISDVPIESNVFYDQFQIPINMTLPPQSYLKKLFEYHLKKFSVHCTENNIDIVVDLTDDDYMWLSRSSDSCIPKDIKDFCSNVCYYASDTLFETKKQVIINRDLLEDTNNKLMFDLTGCGILTITKRDTHKTQQMFDTMSGVGCKPRIKKIKQ